MLPQDHGIRSHQDPPGPTRTHRDSTGPDSAGPESILDRALLHRILLDLQRPDCLLDRTVQVLTGSCGRLLDRTGSIGRLYWSGLGAVGDSSSLDWEQRETLLVWTWSKNIAIGLGIGIFTFLYKFIYCSKSSCRMTSERHKNYKYQDA